MSETGGRLLVTEEQVVTVPDCNKNPQHPRSVVLHQLPPGVGGKGPDPDRLGAIGP